MDIVTLLFQSEYELHNFVLLINPDLFDSVMERKLFIPTTDEGEIELAINGFKANRV